MLQFNAEQIQEKFEQLPKEVQDAVSSPEVHDNLVSIAKKYGLHIDQEGVLVDQVGQVMLGLSPSKDFVKNFMNAGGVTSAVATSVAQDINAEIFSKIKNSMQLIEKQILEKNRTAISDVEQAGDFTVETDHEAAANQTEQGIESHDELIAGIENPVSSETMLVDHLLSGPIVSIEKKTIVDQEPPVPHKPALAQPKKPSGSDLYREPIE
ncbi:MAG TPA: hypothetical protein VL335_00300 [Candidatus Paceibacterota bacterium]|jgi:hypothetical protein|nr:hypothetical protein [Candidatus Paceibacterota bacterium]